MTEAPKTILHIISSAGIGGGERYLLDLVAFSTRKYRHRVILPEEGWLQKELQASKNSHKTIKMPRVLSIRALFAMSQYCRAQQADIIHSHGFRANLYARITAFFCRRPHVATMHVSLYDYLDTPILIRRLYILMEKKLSFITRYFICISQAMKQDLLKMGIDPEKICLIPNGVNPDHFSVESYDPDRLRQQLGISRQGPVIGTVGRLVTEKGQRFLIQALPCLKSAFPDLTCLFIGEGPLLETLQQEARQAGVSDLCRFTGPVADIAKVYPVMDVFVLPSIREPFGLVVLEAMASNVAVVATDTGGPGEYIISGINGVLVSPRDPSMMASEIKKLLSAPEIRSAIAGQGKKMVARGFHVNKMVAAIESVYAKL